MKVFLALGSNVGDCKANIAEAVEKLSEKVSNIKVAPLFISKAVGYTDQPDFHNTALVGETDLKPEELLDFVKSIEQEVGRVYRFRWGPREIDIDIIFYGDQVYKSERLEIPHPRMHERDFVLVPLVALEPELVHPKLGKSVQKLLSQLPRENYSIDDIIRCK